MKQMLSFALVVAVVLGFVAFAYVRSLELRSEESSSLEDAAWFVVVLLVLGTIAVLLDWNLDSFLAVTRAKRRLEVIKPELDAEEARIAAAGRAMSDRQEAPGLWESRARELGAAYVGEYQAEVARQKARNAAQQPFLGEDRRPERED